ncbi:MAG: 3-keto-5-aminohexanoate cleavage protein [Chloroflexota bacterium]
MAGDKIIITAALTGGIHGKEANPRLPEQPDEIVAHALAAREAGAAIVHLLVRAPVGSVSLARALFREVHDRIATQSDVIVQLSTGGSPRVTHEERMGAIVVAPEMCSLNMGLLTWMVWGGEHLFPHKRTDIVHFAEEMRARGVKPEMEVYSLEMLDEVANLVAVGLVEKPYWINFVLNVPAQMGIRGTPDNLLLLVSRARAMFPAGDWLFNVSATGATQLPLTTISMAMGGHARVGMEDNVYYRKGELVRDNAQLVSRAVRIARELEREPATPDEARSLLGLRGRVAPATAGVGGHAG